MGSDTRPTGRRHRPESNTKSEQVCPICGGTGFIVRDLPVEHPDFGKATPCTCTEQERYERRVRAFQKTGSLDNLQRMTFATFVPEPSNLAADKAYNLRKAFEVSQRFADAPVGWLLLTGTYGCGKTHLAAAIANARLAQGEAALFMVVPDLLDHLRATFNPSSNVNYDELFEQVKTTPLLILDDLGAQSSTPWAQEKLFQLLNYRYNAQLPTVITSNQRLEEFEPRLRSRLLHMDLVIHQPITAVDFRAGKNPVTTDLSTLEWHRSQLFDGFDANRKDISAEERQNLREVFQICRNFALSPHGWLVLAGTFGCGKTHLAAAIANFQLDEAQSEVMFIVTPDLLDHLRATFNPQANTTFDRRFESIKKTPLLVLDDLGTESASAWAKEKLFQLLNFRYNAMLPTVITTSQTPDKIEPWLRTRMLDVERCTFCGLIVPGYRGSRSQQQSRPRGGRTR